MDAIHIVGAGGIGCALGYALSTAGCRVLLVDANADKVSWGRKHGVALDRRPACHARFVPFADWDPPPNAVVFLCTKCYDNAEVLPRVPASATLIPVQNGFDPALETGASRLEGIASFVSECDPHRPHTRITRGGHLHLGYREKGPAGQAALLASLAALLRRAPFRLKLVPDVLPYKYTKLMYNAALCPLAAASGLDNGGMLAVPAARQLFFDLLAENYSILAAAGVALGKVGPFHPATVARILRRRSVANALTWAFYPGLRRTYCSMSRDLPAGRTEIDFYNGHLIALAGDRSCPLNRRVYALVKRMERERLRPGLEWLDVLRTSTPAEAA